MYINVYVLTNKYRRVHCSNDDKTTFHIVAYYVLNGPWRRRHLFTILDTTSVIGVIFPNYKLFTIYESPG